MTEKTKEKIMIAIIYMVTHNIKVNKSRVALYAGVSWATVNRYFEEVFPSFFLLDDIRRFKKSMKGGNE